MLCSRVLLATPLALVLVTLAGCGGDESKTARGAEAAVEDFLKQFEDGDYDDACDRLTDNAQQQVVDDWNEFDEDGVDSCAGAFKAGIALAEMMSEDDEELFAVEGIDVEVDGDTAVATVDYKDDDDEDYDLVYEDGTWLIDELGDDDSEEAADDAEDDAEPTDETSEPAAEPSEIGEPSTLGDWTVTVTDVERNADQTLAAPDLYNSDPDHQYVLVTFEATYNGTDRTADAEQLTWSLSGNDDSVYEVDYQTTPADSENWPTKVRPGGTAESQVVFDVDPSVIDGGLLSVEYYGDDGSSSYVDFEF
jgi:hypothetical protein